LKNSFSLQAASKKTEDREEEKVFDMGQNTSAKSPDEAMDIFIEREFPEILEVLKGASHDVKFIPASFIYGNLTEKVMFNCHYSLSWVLMVKAN
jgi:hypothetical protein